MDLRQAITLVVDGISLNADQSRQVIETVMRGEASPAQIAALLVGLRMKGETVEEIVGAAQAMRAAATHIHPTARPLTDTCGTGGDGRGTFNISTTAAFIAAGAGVHIAKHGNRAMSGAVGGADVLEELGVRLDLAAERVAGCIDSVGIGFLFAQSFHPAMRHVAPVRREIGVRTMFNLLGPLSNPAGATRQVVGVFAERWVEPLAHVFGRLGAEHVLVVHSEDGLDEIALSAATAVAELRDGVVRCYRISPEQFGLRRCQLGELVVGDRTASAAMVRAVLNGTPGAARDVAVLNAAAVIYVAGLADSLASAIDLARRSIDSGQARHSLERLVAYTQA